MADNICSLYELEGVNLENIVFNNDELKLLGSLKEERQSCHKCGSNHVIYIGKTLRDFHLPPTGSKKATLQMSIKRHRCKNCNSTWWPQMPFSEGKQRMTKSFVRHILDLLSMATIQDVANHLGVGWDTVKDVHKTKLKEEYEEINIEDVRCISIDEISIAKRHKYMTIITDISTGRIIHAVEGRTKNDLTPFLITLKKKPRI